MVISKWFDFNIIDFFLLRNCSNQFGEQPAVLVRCFDIGYVLENNF